MDGEYQIITFYEFKLLSDLVEVRQSVKCAMQENSILGTIIFAEEGFNATVSGLIADVEKFIVIFEAILQTKLIYKSSFHEKSPFLKAKVKVKSEIVSLRQKVKIENGIGTHASPSQWNKIISDAETLVLDARNDYEVEVGTFRGAINPNIEKFSDLPKFVAEHFDPQIHKKVAMFCTGGIRCEKFAPLMKEWGFAEIYQLDGGILKYLEETPAAESLWEGECFVFDDRIAVDNNLQRGTTEDARPLTVNPPQKK